MSSTYFETQGSSSGRRLCIQIWYSMVQYGLRASVQVVFYQKSKLKH